MFQNSKEALHPFTTAGMFSWLTDLPPRFINAILLYAMRFTGKWNIYKSIEINYPQNTNLKIVPSADINLLFSNKKAILLLKFGTLPEAEKIQKKFSL